MEQLLTYFKDYGLTMQLALPEEKICSFCGSHLTILEVDKQHQFVWVACPHCIASNDNIHDFYSIPLADIGLQQS